MRSIGQDTTSYGADLPPSNGGLAALLRRLDRIDGVGWLRLLYAYPNGFSDEIIDALASCRHVVPYIDLPLQHINDRILARMKRRVTRRQIETLLAKLRDRLPAISLRTTLITGFPGETDAEHRELLAFIEDFRFDMLGVFGYSQEPGTAAARLPGQLPEEVKQARRAELMEAQQRIVFQRNADLIDRDLRRHHGCPRLRRRDGGSAGDIFSLCVSVSVGPCLSPAHVGPCQDEHMSTRSGNEQC